MRIITPVLLIILTVQLSMGQKSTLISVGVSANAYRGDLTSSLEKWSNAFHIGFKLNSGNKLNGNFNLGFGFITGENLNYQFDNGETPAPRPNRFFRTSILVINYELNYNFFKWKNFTFYASQGVGLMRFIPQDQFFEDFQGQSETRAANETFSNITLMLPTQFGFLYLFENNFGLSCQLGLMNSLTDYLDNISEWGTKNGIDNVFSTRFSFHIPLELKPNN